MPSATPAPPRRRTQAERRERTRAALLDATIAVIVEHGYAGATTRAIAERAGVTLGAQTHHFSSKAELVAAALKRLAAQLTDDMVARAEPGRRGSRAQLERLLDGLWEVHTGPIFAASIELWAAARTDAELRASLSEVQREIGVRLNEAVLDSVEDRLVRKTYAEAITTTLAALRGLAMLRVVREQEVDAAWPATRRQLLSLYEPLLERTR